MHLLSFVLLIILLCIYFPLIRLIVFIGLLTWYFGWQIVLIVTVLFFSIVFFKHLHSIKKEAAEKRKEMAEEIAVMNLRNQIRSLYDDGYRYTYIAEKFNQENVPIPKKYSEYKTWSSTLVIFVMIDLIG